MSVNTVEWSFIIPNMLMRKSRTLNLLLCLRYSEKRITDP